MMKMAQYCGWSRLSMLFYINNDTSNLCSITDEWSIFCSSYVLLMTQQYLQHIKHGLRSLRSSTSRTRYISWRWSIQGSCLRVHKFQHLQSQPGPSKPDYTGQLQVSQTSSSISIVRFIIPVQMTRTSVGESTSSSTSIERYIPPVWIYKDT